MVDSWLKGFFNKLLAMTHSQWLFRCIIKHHRTKGTLVLARTEELLKEIERQLDMGVDAIANEDWWMLEMDVHHLRDTSLAEQQYWIHAVEAAQQAGTQASELTKGATSSWAEMKNSSTYLQRHQCHPKKRPIQQCPRTPRHPH